MIFNLNHLQLIKSKFKMFNRLFQNPFDVNRDGRVDFRGKQ